MSSIHSSIGAITIAINGLAAIIGAFAALTYRNPKAFWIPLRTGQALVILDAVIGAGLLLSGDELPRLHLIYGLTPIVVAFVAEQLRLATAAVVLDKRGMESGKDVAKLPQREQHELVASILRREVGVMATSAGVVALLCMRAQGWL
jgi:hypothetical protein